MQSNFIKALNSSQYYANPLVGDPYTSKALGGGSANPELAAYYENELLPYWQAVQSGEIQIAPGEMAQLQQWLQYCQYELGLASSAWGNGMPNQGFPGAEGGMNQGAQGQATYTGDVNEFTVDGSVPTIDVWGSEAILNVPPPCTVTFETTTDNRYNPPETVVKAIITNPAVKGFDGQPKQSVVYVHDGAAITCNASEKADGTSRCSDGTGQVMIGKYSDKPESSTPESSMPGAVQDDGTILYQPEVWDATFIIDFFAKPGNGDQVHIVNANANISVPPDSTVDIKMLGDGSYVVTVKHRDGSSDTYKVAPPSKVNVNANPLQTEINGEAFESVPSEMAERLTINGTDNATGETDSSSPQAIVDSLLAGIQPAVTEEQFLDGLVQAGYLSAGQTMEDFYEKIPSEFPGSVGDKESMERLLNLLKYVDGDANGLFNACFSAEDLDTAAAAFRDRLVTLMGPLFPDSLVRAETEASQLTIGGELVNFNLFSWEGKNVVTIEGSEEDGRIKGESEQRQTETEQANEAEANQAFENSAEYARMQNLASILGHGVSSAEFFNVLVQNYGDGIKSYDADGNGWLSTAELRSMTDSGYIVPPATPDAALLNLLVKMDGSLGDLVRQYQDLCLKETLHPWEKAAAAQLRKDIIAKLVGHLNTVYGSGMAAAASDAKSIYFNGGLVQIIDAGNEQAPLCWM